MRALLRRLFRRPRPRRFEHIATLETVGTITTPYFRAELYRGVTECGATAIELRIGDVTADPIDITPGVSAPNVTPRNH